MLDPPLVHAVVRVELREDGVEVEHGDVAVGVSREPPGGFVAEPVAELLRTRPARHDRLAGGRDEYEELVGPGGEIRQEAVVDRLFIRDAFAHLAARVAGFEHHDLVLPARVVDRRVGGVLTVRRVERPHDVVPPRDAVSLDRRVGEPCRPVRRIGLIPDIRIVRRIPPVVGVPDDVVVQAERIPEVPVARI